MSRPVVARLASATAIAVALAVGLVSPAFSQNQSAEERLRALEEQNRRILERLQQAETRNASLEGELSKLKDETDPHNSAIETEVNKLSGNLAAEGITWKQLTRSGFPIKFYGFFRMDAYYTTARMDSTIIPFFVRNESNGEADENDDAFAFDARLTRFGFDVDGGKICKTAITGKLEIDFANFIAGTVESRETPRMRLAYVNLKNENNYFRIGQDWDVISPLFPAINAESLMWNAGNLGDRRPQVQFGWNTGDPKCAAFEFKVAAGLTGAISNQDLDPTVAGVSNERDGFDSGLPHLQARVGGTFKSWVCEQTMTFGAWGAVAWNETDGEFNGEDEFTTWLVGVDFQLPIIKSLKLRGELWAGTALSDFRGGIAQSINTVTGEEIDSVGGWAEFVLDVSKTFTVAAGGTMDDPDDADLETNNRDLNYSMYVATKYDFGGGFKLGFDVIFWETQYLDTGLGNTIRFDLYTQFDLQKEPNVSKTIVLFGVLAGVLAGQDAKPAPAAPKEAKFDVRHELKVNVPPDAKKVRVWFAYPREDANQTVGSVKVDTSGLPHRLENDADGNTFLYVEAIDPKVKEFLITETFQIARREQLTQPDPAKTRPLTAEETAAHKKDLDANTNVVIDADVQKLAAEITKGEKNPVKAARLIYDWELANVEYWVKDPTKKKASPVGSTKYCMETKTGNCTDFHSLWTSLARASGIPTRMVYGSFLKADLDGKDKDQSYHCWPEFFAPGIGWIPHDVAVADIFVGDFALNADNTEKVKLTTADGYSGPDPAKVNWYFGNLDARRVTWSVGRDLTLSPKQDGGPVNAMAKAYVEVDGKVHPETTGWVRKLTFTTPK